MTTADNPSSWQRRLPPIIFSTFGFCIAMYLAFYQMHIVNSVWDPFSHDGAEKVLTSKLSQKFPIPDALLGALGYLLDLVLGTIGKTDRWRSQPIIVLLFGIVVSLLVLASILLTAAQIFFLHTTCTLCLASAMISVAIAILVKQEILMSIQFLHAVKKEKGSFYKALFGSK